MKYRMNINVIKYDTFCANDKQQGPFAMSILFKHINQIFYLSNNFLSETSW